MTALPVLRPLSSRRVFHSHAFDSEPSSQTGETLFMPL
jgi:hypothetical protein